MHDPLNRGSEPFTPAAVKPRRHPWRRLCLILLVVVLCGWFGRFWLGERLANALRAELATRRVCVSCDSAVFSPWEGISFKAFQVHRDADQAAS